ncbi:hypothetical protein [Pseudomonas sp. MWU13-2100]|uniref:hypothetical protein n=1 Tax=Pseudomonas sp. MWU13-2100 TaxID=2935075 RepID=UPI00200D9239|nr:hypothetical protein [Pseudomonas sp. MWU13-2100]
MKKFKRIISTLGLVCATSIPAIGLAEGQQCQFDLSQSKLETSSCVRNGSISILKLVPRNQPSYETNLENLPTFVVFGDDLDAVLKTVGDGEKSYNNLIKLPNTEQISNSADASVAAKSKMVQDSWRLVNMKDIVYEGPGGSEGPGVVCSTLERKVKEGYVVVSQCNSFYENDISDFKRLLGLIVGQK